MPFFECPGPKYRDRKDAGRVLASRLVPHLDEKLLLLAIPNGGVQVGAVMAKTLGLPMYLMIVRKLNIPDNPEAGFGALCSDGSSHLNQKLVKHIGLGEDVIERQKKKALSSIQRRQQYFGRWAKLPDLEDATVVLVDDGLASGFTMEAAVHSSRRNGAKRVWIAVPTSSRSAFRLLESKVDKIICPDVSRMPVFAVADAYGHWRDLKDDEVKALLDSG